jgi:hypothetical protein
MCFAVGLRSALEHDAGVWSVTLSIARRSSGGCSTHRLVIIAALSCLDRAQRPRGLELGVPGAPPHDCQRRNMVACTTTFDRHIPCQRLTCQSSSRNSPSSSRLRVSQFGLRLWPASMQWMVSVGLPAHCAHSAFAAETPHVRVLSRFGLAVLTCGRRMCCQPAGGSTEPPPPVAGDQHGE